MHPNFLKQLLLSYPLLLSLTVSIFWRKLLFILSYKYILDRIIGTYWTFRCLTHASQVLVFYETLQHNEFYFQTGTILVKEHKPWVHVYTYCYQRLFVTCFKTSPNYWGFQSLTSSKLKNGWSLTDTQANYSGDKQILCWNIISYQSNAPEVIAMEFDLKKRTRKC